MMLRFSFVFAFLLHLVRSASAVGEFVRRVGRPPNIAVEVAASSRTVMVQGDKHHQDSEAKENYSDDHHEFENLEGEGWMKPLEMNAKLAATVKAEEETRLAGLAAGARQIPDSDFQVMYGVVTNGKRKYRDKLEVVLGTWASKPLAHGLFLAVGGKVYPPEWQAPNSVMAADCPDGPAGNSCKEATLVVEAAKRNATWLFIVGEDNYVDTEMIESALQKAASDVPVGLGCIGCGRHHARYGELVAKFGGFCGGCGEALNRASLQRLTAEGGAALVQEYGGETQCDMSTSQALRKRGIPMRPFPGQLHGSPVFSQRALERMVGKAATFHYATPQVMRWIHMKRTGTGAKNQEAQALEAEAFELGCARGMDNPYWHGEIEACRRQHLDDSR